MHFSSLKTRICCVKIFFQNLIILCLYMHRISVANCYHIKTIIQATVQQFIQYSSIHLCSMSFILGISRCRIRARGGAKKALQSMRFNWQGFLTKHYDRATGKYKYDDWDEIMTGSTEPMKGSKSLLERHLNNVEHIKPKEIKRRINERIILDSQTKRIDDLTRYIKFMREHPEDFGRSRKK
jgi:hypothetical protein